jgi:hypothetical protein
MPPIRNLRSAIRNRFVRVAIFAAALALFNLVCIYGLPAQIDLTGSRLFSPAPQTRNLLAALDSPVEITLLAPKTPKTSGEMNFRHAAAMFRELLETCRQIQPRLHLEELDPAESDRARRLLASFPDAAPPCVLMTYGSPEKQRHEVLTARDLAEFRAGERGPAAAVDFFGEQALAAALARMTSGRTRALAYVSVGHGELAPDDADTESRHGMGLLAEALRELDCEVRPLDFGAVPRVPSDAKLVIIAGGEQPWASSESEKLETYLRQGGRALVLVDLHYDSRKRAAVPTGLEEVLSEFGVAVGNDRVITRGFTGQVEVASPALPAAVDHPLVRSLPQSPLVLFECRSIQSSTGLRQIAGEVVPLLVSHSAPRAWAEGDFDSQAALEPGGRNDSDGPVAMAVAIEQRRQEGAAPVLVVVGDAEFLSNRILSGPAGRVNSSFALSCINWLRGRRELMGDIPPRRHEGYRLAGSPDDHRGLVWKSSLALWSLIATAGFTVWTVRRVG